MDNQNIENAEELHNGIATGDNIESQDQEPIEESEELEETDHTDGDEEADEPDLTPGVKKRIAKLAQKHEREKAELRAEFTSQMAQLQQNIASQQQRAQTPSDAQMQQQYQQIYGQQQPNQFVDPGNPQQPTYEQFSQAVLQVQARAEAEKQRAAQEAEFSQGVSSVAQKSLARSYQDSEYKALLDTHGNLLTAPMVYGLKGLKNPDSFLKHLLKKDTDRAAMRQLQQKNPLEQASTMAHWGAQFEAQAVRPNVTAPKPKPIPQPKGSGSINARVRVGIDPNNPATHTKENIRAFMAGR